MSVPGPKAAFGQVPCHVPKVPVADMNLGFHMGLIISVYPG